MTPTERARQIDREEFKAECAAVRQRAYDWLAAQRPTDIAINRTAIVRYDALGKSATLKEWAEWSGISPSTLYTRINVYCWPVERAVTEAVGKFGRRGREHVINGVSLSVAQWANLSGISSQVVHTRINSGWPIEAALTFPKGSKRPGVSSDFAPSEGTGAGSTAQESTNITFSGIDA